MKKTKNSTIISSESILRAIPLPKKTKTYTVISHGHVIDKIKEELNKAGFTIDRAEYTHSHGGDIARGNIYLHSDKDLDMGLIFTWINSYNKMVKFSCAVGGFIYDNNTSFIGSEGMYWLRKHTGTALDEADNVIEQLASHANKHFDEIILEKERMKAMPLSIDEYGCVMGALYFELDLLTPNQASGVKNERKKPQHTYKDSDTLWGLYKILMFGISDMPLNKWQTSQQKLHHTIMNEYAIATTVDDTNKQESLLARADLHEEMAKMDAEIEADSSNIGQLNGPEIHIESDDEYYQRVASIEAEPEEVNATEEANSIQARLRDINFEESPEDRLEYIRGELQSESISTDELIELQSLVEHIDPSDVELLEAAGIPEFDDRKEWADKILAEEPVGEDVGPPEMYEGDIKIVTPEELMNEYNNHLPISESNEDVKLEIEEKKDDQNREQFRQETLALNYAVEDVDRFIKMSYDTNVDVVDNINNFKDLEKQSTSSTNLSAELTLFTEEELELQDNLSIIFPTANEDELQRMASPYTKEESFQEKEEEEINFLDIKEHDCIISNEIIGDKALIEKKMAELYGEIKPYTFDKTANQINVTLNETYESFYLKL